MVSEALEQVEILEVSPSEILLDPNSYRLIDDPLWRPVPDDEIADPEVQERTHTAIMRATVDGREDSIRELRASMDHNGWIYVSPLYVRRLPSGHLVIVDGNRRVVAWRSRSRSMAAQQRSSFDKRVPFTITVTEILNQTSEVASLALGLRHLVAPKPWTALSKALWSSQHYERYSDWPSIGTGTFPMDRAIRMRDIETQTLDLARKFRQGDWGSLFSSHVYDLLRQAVSENKIAAWLFSDDQQVRENHMDRFFSWITRRTEENPTPEEGGFNSESQEQGPVIRSPGEIRRLGYIIDKPELLDRLDDGVPLDRLWRTSQSRLVIDEPESYLHPTVLYRLSRRATVDPARANKALLELREALVSQMETPVESGTDFPWELLNPDSAIALRSLTLSQFRGLSGVVLTDLGQINLFVGVNNAGKTSVLEALYLLCHLSDPRGLLDTLQTRTRQDPERNPALLSHLVSALQIDLAAQLDDGARVTLGLSRSTPPDGVDLATHIPGLRLDATMGEVRYATETQLFSNRPRRTVQTEGKNLWLAPVVLHSPFASQNRMAIVRWYEASVERGSLDGILTTLREAVDSDIKDIRLVSETGRFVVEHQRRDPMDLSSYGEGLQRVFEIGLLFAAHKGGLVLIDELETAIHTSALIRFTRMIQELAVKFDVQVFITTHSKETVDAFLLNEYRTDDVVAYLLKPQEQGRLVARRFGGAALKRAIEVGDVDLRRL